MTQKPSAYNIPFSCYYLHISQNDRQTSSKTHQGYETRERMIESSEHSSKTEYNIYFDKTEALDTI